VVLAPNGWCLRLHVSSLHLLPQPFNPPSSPLHHFHRILTRALLACLPPVQVVLVSASLRGSLASAQAWIDQDPITINSSAPVGTTPAARAARAAAAAAAAVPGVAAAGGHPPPEGESRWSRMLPDTISHQVCVVLCVCVNTLIVLRIHQAQCRSKARCVCVGGGGEGRGAWWGLCVGTRIVWSWVMVEGMLPDAITHQVPGWR
jgi:hypothetical protein